MICIRKYFFTGFSVYIYICTVFVYICLYVLYLFCSFIIQEPRLTCPPEDLLRFLPPPVSRDELVCPGGPAQWGQQVLHCVRTRLAVHGLRLPRDGVCCGGSEGVG